MVLHFPALPSRLLRMQAAIAILHRKLTSLGATEIRRPALPPAGPVRSISMWSEFNSANLAHLKAEVACLERRSESLSPPPKRINRSLGRLREQVEWLEGLLPGP
jgi:hypothetical protein